MGGSLILFHDTLFEVLGKVSADFGGGAFCCNLGDVVFYHEFHQLFEAGLVRIPLQLGLGLRRVTRKWGVPSK